MASTSSATSLHTHAHYESSYLYARDPQKYGGKQDEYLCLAEQAICKATQMIQSGVDSEKKITDLFFEVKEMLCQARHEIALKHTPETAHFFGIARASQDHTMERGRGHISPLTCLAGCYEEYNKIFMEQFGKIMSTMRHDLKTFTDKKYSQEERVLDRSCKFEIEIIDGRDIQRLQWDHFPQEEFRAAVTTEKPIEDAIRDFNLMKELKSNHPELYKKISMGTYIKYLYIAFPSPMRVSADDEPLDYVGNTDNLKTHYALGTLRLEIEGKRFAIGRFLTWLYTDYSTDPVKRMMKCSSAIVIHQDPFLVDETLQAISKMFEQAVLWNAETDSKQDLKNRVALFRFTYAYCMPSSRGDGAIGDWFEMALYRLHGFANTRYNPDRLPCFEPLVSISLSRYLEHYDQTITVE